MLTCNSFATQLPPGDSCATLHPDNVEYRSSPVICVCLNPSTEYELRFEPSGAILPFKTAPWMLSPRIPLGMRRSYISNASIPFLSPLIETFPSEYFWTDSFEVSLWTQIFRAGMFCLPQGEVVLIPNPFRRFCFDLTGVVRWKVTRKMKPDEFKLRVQAVTSESLLSQRLRQCSEYHDTHSGSTWITEDFIATILSMIPEMEFHILDLEEVSTGKLAAFSLGFRHKKNSFMDFTAVTLIRDKRSAGKVLIVKAADWLTSAGVKLWYLGFQLPYMQTLSEDGRFFSRAEFAIRW